MCVLAHRLSVIASYSRILSFSKAESQVNASECESSSQFVSELNECHVVNEIESEECDNLGDLAYLISDDADNNEFNDTVKKETEVDNPCHFSHVSQPTASKDCEILLQSGLSAEQKLEIISNFSKYNPVATYNFPMKVEYGKNFAFQHR